MIFMNKIDFIDLKLYNGKALVKKKPDGFF